MSKQVINVGSSPNDGTGEALRTALQKANDNFTELYAVGTELKATVAQGSGVNLTSGTPGNLGFIDLPVGAWDVEMLACLDMVSVTSITRFYASLSTVSASPTVAPGSITDALVPGAGIASPPSSFPTLFVGRRRVVVTSGTTRIYGVAGVFYAGGGIAVWGQLKAVKAMV